MSTFVCGRYALSIQTGDLGLSSTTSISRVQTFLSIALYIGRLNQDISGLIDFIKQFEFIFKVWDVDGAFNLLITWVTFKVKVESMIEIISKIQLRRRPGTANWLSQVYFISCSLQRYILTLIFDRGLLNFRFLRIIMVDRSIKLKDVKLIVRRLIISFCKEYGLIIWSSRRNISLSSFTLMASNLSIEGRVWGLVIHLIVDVKVASHRTLSELILLAV